MDDMHAYNSIRHTSYNQNYRECSKFGNSSLFAWQRLSHGSSAQPMTLNN